MRRGTTPTLTFTVPFDVTDVTELYLTFKQDCRVVEKTLEDCELEEGKVIVTLTQEETLKFCDGNDVYIQMRVKYRGGATDASNIIRTEFRRILKEGVI